MPAAAPATAALPDHRNVTDGVPRPFASQVRVCVTIYEDFLLAGVLIINARALKAFLLNQVPTRWRVREEVVGTPGAHTIGTIGTELSNILNECSTNPQASSVPTLSTSLSHGTAPPTL